MTDDQERQADEARRRAEAERRDVAERQAEELRKLREASEREALKGMLGDKDKRETGGPDDE